jgi:hypothetical protein
MTTNCLRFASGRKPALNSGRKEDQRLYLQERLFQELSCTMTLIAREGMAARLTVCSASAGCSGLDRPAPFSFLEAVKPGKANPEKQTW